MESSIIYRVYIILKNIYMDSKIIEIFSRLFSSAFNVIVNSRIFLITSNSKSIETLKRSLIWKIISKTSTLITVCFSRDYIKNTVNNSFFINYVRDIMVYRKNDSINKLILIPIVMLIVNMGIKITMGSFSLIGNRYFIGMLFVLIVLYFLQLEYWTILKNSKVVSYAYEIFYDEPFDDHI